MALAIEKSNATFSQTELATLHRLPVTRSCVPCEDDVDGTLNLDMHLDLHPPSLYGCMTLHKVSFLLGRIWENVCCQNLPPQSSLRRVTYHHHEKTDVAWLVWAGRIPFVKILAEVTVHFAEKHRNSHAPSAGFVWLILEGTSLGDPLNGGFEESPHVLWEGRFPGVPPHNYPPCHGPGSL